MKSELKNRFLGGKRKVFKTKSRQGLVLPE